MVGTIGEDMDFHVVVVTGGGTVPAGHLVVGGDRVDLHELHGARAVGLGHRSDDDAAVHLDDEVVGQLGAIGGGGVGGIGLGLTGPGFGGAGVVLSADVDGAGGEEEGGEGDQVTGHGRLQGLGGSQIPFKRPCRRGVVDPHMQFEM